MCYGEAARLVTALPRRVSNEALLAEAGWQTFASRHESYTLNLAHRIVTRLPDEHPLRRQRQQVAFGGRIHASATEALFGESNEDVTAAFGRTDKNFKAAVKARASALQRRELELSSKRSAQLLAEVLPTGRSAHFTAGPRRWSSMMSRLRVGASPLNADAYRHGLCAVAKCPHCDAGVDEGRSHFLLECPKWATQRARLWDEIRTGDVDVDLPCDTATLLGSDEAVAGRRQLTTVAEATQHFLAATGRFDAN